MFKSLLAGALLALGPYGAQAIILPYKPVPADVLEGEKIYKTSSTGARPMAAATVAGSTINRAGWTVTVDSFQSGTNNEGPKAIDGDTNTLWHSQWNPPIQLPHTITVDMGQSYNVDGLTILPRQDGNSNGNIGQHEIYLSTDGTNFGSPVAYGVFIDDATLKGVSFETKPARYVRIKAITEAGGRGPWTSIAELNVYQAASYTPPSPSLGRWGQTINFPLVPVAAALEPVSGKVLTWSSYAADTFTNGPGGKTLTSTWDPSSKAVTSLLVTNTQHDMFCPGISIDGNGRVVVTGGNNAEKTSIYDFSSDSWIPGGNMQIPRGYQSSATLSDGRIFTIGGGWSGGNSGKNGEIYSPSSNSWSLLSGCPVAPMLTADTQGPAQFRQDNHGWLFGWKNGYVFQAGPSKAMNWYGTSGSGSQSSAGSRTGDNDAMCGTAIMYDAVAGKILSMGGSPNYQGTEATGNAQVITIGTPPNAATVTTVGSMAYHRIFANAVALPDGKVFVTGGQTLGNPFSDDGADYTPELYNPATQTFTKMNPNTIPRTYHSVGILLLDGTVFSGGGGLCSTCSTNHFDAQIFTPPYLLTSSGAPATRPTISNLSVTTIRVGQQLTITTGGAISKVALMRYGSSTHTVNTDQRRVPLTPSGSGTSWKVTIPSNTGVVLPGYYMVFVLNSSGVPSVAKTIKVTS